jgi:hypothetical protein
MSGHRVRIVALALAGAAVAAYLTLVQTRVVDHGWDPFFGTGTDRVLHSSFSESLPFPDAALGLVAYVAEAVLGLTDIGNRWERMALLPLLFDLVGLGLGTAAVVLVVLQATAVGSWCTACLASATISLLIVALGRLRAGRAALERVRSGRRSGASWREALVGVA